MKELLIFFNEFYLDNKAIVIITIILKTIISLLKTNVIPYILAALFSNIEKKGALKKSLLQLIAVWVIYRILFSVSLHYKNIFENKLLEYIMKRIVKSYIIKYDTDNLIPNVAILLDKTMSLKNSLEECIDIITVDFIPKILAIFISCIQFFMINLQLGVVTFICIVLQFCIYIFNNNKCIIKGVDEYDKKDYLYEYIEEIFNNINIIQSTNNGYNLELKNIGNIISKYGKAKIKNNNCINKKQYLGYFTNVIIFSVIIFTIYKLNRKSKIDNENTLKAILLLIGMFDTLNDFTFNIPELMRKISQLKNLEPVMKDILKYKKFKEESNDINVNMSNFNITFDKVSFGYTKNNLIFDNFSVVIPRNNIVTIYGQSGCGKTTFIKLIFGILKPKSGNIKIGGIDYTHFRKYRKYIAYIQQNTNNLFNRTIFENIMYGYDYTDSEKEKLKEKVKNVIDKFDLYIIFSNLDKGKKKWSFLDDNTGKLGSKISGGQKKIVYLLKAYFSETSKVIILDEPTSGLDNITKTKIINFFQQLKSIGKILLIITHNNEIKNIGDKILQFYNDKNPEFVK